MFVNMIRRRFVYFVYVLSFDDVQYAGRPRLSYFLGISYHLKFHLVRSFSSNFINPSQ
jgi:hypothetical protein